MTVTTTENRPATSHTAVRNTVSTDRVPSSDTTPPQDISTTDVDFSEFLQPPADAIRLQLKERENPSGE